jgi:UDP-N-acetylmuramoyl-tripeptide--D-alanyl-D-alanine ligase
VQALKILFITVYLKGLVQGEIKASEPFLTVRITAGLGPDALLIQSQLVGEYNLPNILCAATIGKYFGVPDYKIIEAIESYAPSNSRSQLIERGNNKVILDAYNANPSSMKVAIENFAKLKADRKIVTARRHDGIRRRQHCRTPGIGKTTH